MSVKRLIIAKSTFNLNEIQMTFLFRLSLHYSISICILKSTYVALNSKHVYHMQYRRDDQQISQGTETDCLAKVYSLKSKDIVFAHAKFIYSIMHRKRYE